MLPAPAKLFLALHVSGGEHADLKQLERAIVQAVALGGSQLGVGRGGGRNTLWSAYLGKLEGLHAAKVPYEQ